MLKRVFQFYFLLQIVSFGLVAPVAFAQPTAITIASGIEKQLNSGQAVRMKFSLKDAGSFNLLADLHANRVRIETSTLIIVTDGTTVWNYNKDTKQLTIDGLSTNKNSALQHPADLFQFSKNYLLSIESQKGQTYTLKLVPLDRVKDMLKQLGEIQSMHLVVSKSGKAFKIKSATIETLQGNSATSSLSVTSVKKTREGDFTFQAPPNSKIIDLRD